MFKEALVSLLVAMTPFHKDVEEPDARVARMTMIAEAIDAAAGADRELAFAVAKLGGFETNYALHVHAAQCRTAKGECDHGRAVGPWQGWMTPEERARAEGDSREATFEAARIAARRFAFYRARCGSLEGGFAGYATGGRCTWQPKKGKGAKERAAETRAAMAR